MTLQVFPESVLRSFPIPIKERFDTLVTGYEGENEVRQMGLRFPLRSVSIPFNKVTDADWPTLHSFFRKRLGGYEPFWFFGTKKRNYVDEYVGRGGPFDVDGAVADDGGVQTDERDAARNDTANDMTLTPAVPVVGDKYGFMSKIKCDKLTVTIGTQGAGTWTITWKYWNGSALVAFSGVTDGTNGFKAAAGDHDVTLTMPDDWVDEEVKGRNGYWIWAVVTAFTSISTQPKGTKATCNTKTYDLPSKNTVYLSGLDLVINGGMELDSDWASVDTPEINERSGVQKYLGSYSRHVNDSVPSSGGIRQDIVLGASKQYRLPFWVYVVSGEPHVQIWNVTDGTILTQALGTSASWIYKGFNFNSISAVSTAFMFKNISGVSPAEFYIDEVSLQEIDAGFHIYINDPETLAYQFVSGGGGGGADRIAFADYVATGALIRADFVGLLRVKTALADELADDWYRQRHSRFEFTLREVP